MIGAALPRTKDRGLLAGRARFLDDIMHPGLLHLGVVRRVHAHARLIAIDTTPARGRPGVVAAFTAADPPEAATPIPTPYGATPRTRPPVQPLLARDTVRSVGDPVALVERGCYTGR